MANPTHRFDPTDNAFQDGRYLRVGLHELIDGTFVNVSPATPLPAIITAVDGTTLRLEKDGAVPVSLQDQTSPAVILPFNRSDYTTTLTNLVAVGDKTFTVDDSTGFAASNFVVITNLVDNRYYICDPIDVTGSVVTVDSPLDFAFTAGSTVTAGTKEMNKDGSSTPQIFSVRAVGSGLPLTMDITRLMFECQTSDPITLPNFGDIVGGLALGLVLRYNNGAVLNITNFKTNGGIKIKMFDMDILQATNPAQGVNGFIARWTFAGTSKMGVVIRLGPDEDLEILIQDDLSSLVRFRIIAEGHVVVF